MNIKQIEKAVDGLDFIPSKRHRKKLKMLVVCGILLSSLTAGAYYLTPLFEIYTIEIQSPITIDGEDPLTSNIYYDEFLLVEATVTADIDVLTLSPGDSVTFTHKFENTGTGNVGVTFDLSNMPDTTQGVWEGVTFSVYDSGTTDEMTSFGLDSGTIVFADYFYGVAEDFMQPDPPQDFLFDMSIFIDMSPITPLLLLPQVLYHFNNEPEQTFPPYTFYDFVGDLDLETTGGTYGAPCFLTPGFLGSDAVVFDANLSYFNYLVEPSGVAGNVVDIDQDWSISLWFKQNQHSIVEEYLLSKGDATASWGVSLLDGDIAVNLNAITLTTGFTADTWHYLAITHTASNSNIRLYLDNVLAIDEIVGTGTISSVEPLEVGYQSAVYLDELFIIDAVLTTEIDLLWNEGNGLQI